MFPKYRDILELADRVGIEPVWWDEHGVPRFAPFDPTALGVYDRFAVLGEVMCAACGKYMRVGIGRPKNSFTYGRLSRYDMGTMKELIKAWGDPPRHDDQRIGLRGHGCAGETMVCDPVRVVGTWERGKNLQWRQVMASIPATSVPMQGTKEEP